jgi:spermidine synthase
MLPTAQARTYYLSTSALTGAVVLGLEVLATRTLAPALGSGPVTWSAVLAVALGALAAGNLMGGALSRRVSACRLIAWALAVSSACLVLVSQFHAAAVQWSADQPLAIGAIAAALVTQAVPLGMLGAISPAILDQERNATGRWAGTVLAAGSGGGIAGALGAGLVLLPGLGLTRCYLFLAGLLAVAALPAARHGRHWAAGMVLLVLLGMIAVCWRRHPPEAIVQSQYGQLEVRDIGLSRVLLVDGLPQTGLPEALAPGEALRCGYLLEAALAMGPKPSRALVIGLGAGLAPRLLAGRGIDCQSVEIDPRVVEIARREFGFTGRVTIADGRAFLSRAGPPLDLVFLDVCTSDRLAWHLFTVEAMRALRRRLSPSGLAVIQFLGDDGPWSASLARTVGSVFAHSVTLAARSETGRVGPRWLVASNGRPLDPGRDFHARPSAAPWEVIRPSQRGALLSDDHFPAELDWARTAREWRTSCAAHR